MELGFDINTLRFKRIAVYGTGKNAKKFLIEHGEKLDIGNIIDPAKTGKFFLYKKILPIEEVIQTVDLILICASVSVELIIYNRIYDLCREKGIELYGINGGNLFEFYGKGFNQNASKEEILEQIDIHDVISFDLFDTLLGRRTLYPADVYAIVQSRMEMAGLVLNNFYLNRIQAELEAVKTKEFRLNEVYNRLQSIYGFDNKVKEQIKEMELQTEREVSVSRKLLSEIFLYALSKGKKVYILTDMYLPKVFLDEILSKQGISGYEDILVSGELCTNKHDGMYVYFKQMVKSRNILHIGDSYVSDGYFAKKEGIDVCIVPSAKDRLVRSEYRSLMNYSGGGHENLAIGMFAAAAFNNKFTQISIEPEIMTEYVILFLAPLITGFVIWIALEVKKRPYEKILFAARDGFLLMNLYRILRKFYPEYNLPEEVYLYTSRKAVWHVYENKADKNEKNNDYAQYLCKQKLKKEGKYAFVDLISRGTTQAALEKIFFDRLDGLYLVQYTRDIGQQNNIYINSLYKETPITEMYFTEHSNLILETFLTSFEPSLREIGKDGRLIFETEFRTNAQLGMIRDVQQIIRDYFEIYCKLSDMKSYNKELMKEIWRLRKKANIRKVAETIRDMKIEDSLNQNQLSFENQL